MTRYALRYALLAVVFTGTAALFDVVGTAVYIASLFILAAVLAGMALSIAVGED